MSLGNKNFHFKKYDSSKKSICFVISSGMSLRNILLKSSLDSISKLQDKFNIVFITEKHYLDTYNLNLNFIQIKNIDNKFVLIISKFLNIVSRALFDKLNYTDTKRIKYRYNFLGNFYIKTFYKLRFFIPKNYSLLYVVRSINNFLIREFSKDIRDLIESLNPAHVISMDPINKKEYSYLLHSQKFCNTSAIIKSFDNITSKGYIPFVPEKIFVWNSIMVKEARDAYGYFKPKIFAIGAPQYDHLRLESEYFKEKSKQILYCTNSSNIYDDDEDNIEYIFGFIQKYDFKLIIRVKQTDDTKRWEKYSLFKNVEIYPKNVTNNDANKKCSDINHQISLVEQVKTSFVVISSYSSMIYDCLALKTPCINLGYTLSKKYKGWTINKCEEFNHIKPLLSPKCVDNVRSQQALKSKIIQRYKYGFNQEEEKERLTFVQNFLGENLKNTTFNNLFKYLDLS